MRLFPSWLNAYIFLTVLFCSFALAQENDSLEGLYLEAGKKNQAGDFEGALPVYEKMIKYIHKVVIDDFGSGSIGNIYFDYGTCLLQLSRWEEARDAFKNSIDNYPDRENRSKLHTQHGREALAFFQWGYCEQQLGSPIKAIKLYKQYRNSRPSMKEWEAVRAFYHLRLGGALIAAGKMDDTNKRNAEREGLIQKYLSQQDWIVNCRKARDKACETYIKNMRERWLPRRQLDRMPEVEEFIRKSYKEFWSEEAVTELFAEVLDRYATNDEIESWIDVPKDKLNEEQMEIRRYIVEYIREAVSLQDISHCKFLATKINNAERKNPPYEPKLIKAE